MPCRLVRPAGQRFRDLNRESGDRRYDIQLKPTKGTSGVLIELKAEKNCSGKRLKNYPRQPSSRSTTKNGTELTTARVRTIYKYSVKPSAVKG